MKNVNKLIAAGMLYACLQTSAQSLPSKPSKAIGIIPPSVGVVWIRSLDRSSESGIHLLNAINTSPACYATGGTHMVVRHLDAKNVSAVIPLVRISRSKNKRYHRDNMHLILRCGHTRAQKKNKKRKHKKGVSNKVKNQRILQRLIRKQGANFKPTMRSIPANRVRAVASALGYGWNAFNSFLVQRNIRNKAMYRKQWKLYKKLRLRAKPYRKVRKP